MAEMTLAMPSPAPPRGVLNLDARVRARHGAWGAERARHLTRMDPLADELAMRLADDPALRPRVHELLRGARLQRADPAALRAFIDSLRARPEWVDLARANRGGRAYISTGPMAAFVLSTYSLPVSYASPDGNKPLVLTGALTRSARQRLANTGRYVLEVCREGGLEFGAPGFVLSAEVRLMHAAIRQRLLRDPRWEAAWGVPINQLYLAGTGVLFGVAVVEGLRRLGVPLDEDERGDLVHLWRYAAHLMGVDETLNPRDEAAGLRLDDFLRDARQPADRDSRRLISALLDSYGEQTADVQLTMWSQRALLGPLVRSARASERDIESKMSRFYRRLAEALTRFMVGDALADELGLAHGGERYVRGVRTLCAAYDRARRRDPAHAYREGILGWERAS